MHLSGDTWTDYGLVELGEVGESLKTADGKLEYSITSVRDAYAHGAHDTTHLVRHLPLCNNSMFLPGYDK